MPRFIICKKLVKEGKEDRYVTSNKPKKHLDMEVAVAEAMRLANKEKKPFAIFKEETTIHPTA